MSEIILLNHAKRLRDFILNLIFPIECFSCGKEGKWLCEDCFKKLKFKSTQYCLHCKKENEFGEFCKNCQKYYNLNSVLIASLYDDKIIAQLIKKLKYHFIKNIADDLGKFLCLFLNGMMDKSRLNKIDLIVPVPLSHKRKRWRGFNQAEIIADKVAEYFNMDMSANKLIRIRHKTPQAKLGEKARKNNVIGCFDWRGGELNGKNIILIDDVATTGATLNECASVLKQNGAGEVLGLVVAKG